jgi:phosphoribosyl-ATP pyrophosphohydrolase
LQQAINKWGEECQYQKAIEECAELIKAICKRDKLNIIEECADVLIMAEQIKMMIGREDVDKIINYKLKRLKGRIEEV